MRDDRVYNSRSHTQKVVNKNDVQYSPQKKSQMKRIMNIFLTQCTTQDSNAIVIDAETLMSSKTLKKHGLTPDNIIVLNSDKDVIKEHTNKVIPIQQ